MAARTFNGPYTDENLDRIAFPLGGLGTGTICMDGAGGFTHASLRNKPEMNHEPRIFAAVHAKRSKDAADPGVARVVEARVPLRHGYSDGRGMERLLGLPRFRKASFKARFPFAELELEDADVPVKAKVVAFNPFVPNDADASSLPVAGLEYTFTNPTKAPLDVVFSFHCKNFTRRRVEWWQPDEDLRVEGFDKGFALYQDPKADKPWEEAALAVFSSEPETNVDCQWFRGGWFDEGTVLWQRISAGDVRATAPYTDTRVARGGSLYMPFTLEPGASKTLRVQMAWYTPKSDLRQGQKKDEPPIPVAERTPETHHVPWYAARFPSVKAVAEYFRSNYADLREKSERFSKALFRSTLPPEVVEAVSANLSILKSPTVLRQHDGRFWGWEGTADEWGSCHGTCQHVWNYAQAMAHLFPELERGIRETEHEVTMDERGHQEFRAPLPIRPAQHAFHAATDGQLGGVMKVYREWRVSGSKAWLERLWPNVEKSVDYCIKTWDPRATGALEEPQHNTYDIEFWGPNGMLTTFYLGALEAASRMGEALGKDVSQYRGLLAKGKKRIESELFDGEYFVQKTQIKGLDAPDPTKFEGMGKDYSPEALALLEKEGPKYQYGTGCISDGVLGCWIALQAGIDDDIVDRKKIASHLLAVFKHNFRKDLSAHANPQRHPYALAPEGGLLLCTWPKGGALTIPFPYSDEVWTGIEYQVACHLIALGHVKEGLEIVRAARLRYDGAGRNPFDEIECGHWYSRALASYGLLSALSGARYDAVDKVLYLSPKVPGDFESFLCTATGYGTVGVKGGKPFFEVSEGKVDVTKIDYKPLARSA